MRIIQFKNFQSIPHIYERYLISKISPLNLVGMKLAIYWNLPIARNLYPQHFTETRKQRVVTNVIFFDHRTKQCVLSDPDLPGTRNSVSSFLISSDVDLSQHTLRE